MNEASSFENKSGLFGDEKKLILIYQNTISILWYVEKIVFWDKNSDLCISLEIKSFHLKKYQICFLRTKKKKRFLITKKSDLFFI